MAYQRQNFEDSAVLINHQHDHDHNNHQDSSAFEQLFYEVRPVLFMIAALVALKYNVDGSMLGKLSCVMLIGISAFILYSRMLARGHLK